MVEIVAEISGNHGGVRAKALELIWKAAHCGCTYAKFQYYRPEDMPDRAEGDNDAMYRKLAVPDDWLPDLFHGAKKCGIGLFASVFSLRAVQELLKYDVPYVKLGSPASTLLPGERYREIIKACSIYPCSVIASTTPGYPLIHSADLYLYCPTGHPPFVTAGEAKAVMPLYYGFSDHTPGIAAPLAFILAGAQMIEKHFKLDNDCVDAAFSADPNTMRQLCRIANG